MVAVRAVARQVHDAESSCWLAQGAGMKLDMELLLLESLLPLFIQRKPVASMRGTGQASTFSTF